MADGTSGNPKNKTYEVVTTDNQKHEIKADRTERDGASGRLSFYDGDELVAEFINVSRFTRK